MREAESPERQLIACLRQAGITVSGEVRRLGLSGKQPETVGSLPPTPYWSIVRAPEGVVAYLMAVDKNGTRLNPEPAKTTWLWTKESQCAA